MNEIIIDTFNTHNEFSFNQDTMVKARLRLRGIDQIKSNLVFDHNASQLKTRIDLRFVLYDMSTLDIDAVVKVCSKLKNIDTYLSIKVLLVSKNARARVVPSIEISENEVRGGHGATIGQIDEFQLNYLRSRGLSFSTAEDLLVESFLN